MVGIYKITSPSGKIYIGQSIDLEKREYYYKRGVIESIGRKIFNSLYKYGWVNHKFEIVEICEKKDLDDREIFWIKNFDCVNVGLNIDFGGRNKYLQKNLSQKLNPKLERRKIDQYDLDGNFIKRWSTISDAVRIYGGGITSNLVNKTKSSSGFIWRYEGDVINYTICDKNKSRKKPVIQYDLSGNKIKEWISITAIEKELGFKNQSISVVCSNDEKYKHRKIAYGFKWTYK